MDETIVALLRKKKQGMSFAKIARELELSAREKRILRKNLKKLEGQAVVQRRKDIYFLPQRTDLLRGEFISASSRGFGFVRPEGGGSEDIFIPARYTAGALPGDKVEILFKEKGKKGKPEARVVRILEKSRKSLMGIYSERNGQPFCLPFDSPSSAEIPLISKASFSPQTGMIIEVDRETRRIRSVLGMPDEPGVDTLAVIQRYNLASEFPAEVLKEAQRISKRIARQDREGRRDFRGWKTVTIDGESAQDFDDAVSIKRLETGNYLLGVHIADVSHYVKPGPALDRAASARGTSVYFPDLTLPMLPEKLSNDVCSLKPRETRLTFSVLLEVDQSGTAIRTDFHPSLIKTAERMTYTSVYKIFQGDKKEREKYSPLVPDFLLMRELARLMRKRREAEGSLNFDLLEPELVYREGRLAAVAAFEQNEAHHLIEEFMVAANVAVASLLSRKKIPSLYRVHPKSVASDLEELRQSLLRFGILLPKPDKIKSKDLQQALKQAEGKPGEKFINFQVLRALRLAVYSDENIGHYGLAKEEYTHFTSPIRRYPDLIVHRILKNVLAGKLVKTAGLGPLSLHCSRQERNADEAEKELIEWRIYRFLKGKLGEEFAGIVTEISPAGLVVEIEDYFVEGLIPFADLGGDYYRRSDVMLVGKRTGKKFSLGDRLNVILAAVDPVLRRISLVLSAGNEKARR